MEERTASYRYPRTRCLLPYLLSHIISVVQRRLLGWLPLSLAVSCYEEELDVPSITEERQKDREKNLVYKQQKQLTAFTTRLSITVAIKRFDMEKAT